MPNDFLQPMKVSRGYFADAEQLKDFIDFLFDVEKVGDYREMFERFLRHEETAQSTVVIERGEG